MAGNGRISRKQERFLEQLLLGCSIVDAAASCDVAERTARRWVKGPVFCAARTAREEEIRAAEQAELDRILSSGYAVMERRVEALNKLARHMEEPYVQQETGKTYHLRNSPDHVREWRGLLDDIASELGQRVKKTKTEHSGALDVTGARDALFEKLEMFAKAHESSQP